MLAVLMGIDLVWSLLTLIATADATAVNVEREKY